MTMVASVMSGREKSGCLRHRPLARICPPRHPRRVRGSLRTMSEAILHEVSDRILTLSLHRPNKKNALTLDMYNTLVEHLDRADSDPQIRAIVLRGEGGVFTAGNDLADFMESPPDNMDSPVGRLLARLPRIQTPLVASVDGVAVGIGTTLLLHCDFVYCTTRAIFKLPFVPLGLCPEAGSSWLLPRLVGRVRANELLLLGDAFDAQAALEMGIVNAVVESPVLDTMVHDIAMRLASLPPASVRLTKQLIAQSQQAPLEEAMNRESAQFMQRLRSPEAREAMQAFFEKRPPDFTRFD